MEVLVCLSQQSGEVVSKERLMKTVWADTFVTDEVSNQLDLGTAESFWG